VLLGLVVKLVLKALKEILETLDLRVPWDKLASAVLVEIPVHPVPRVMLVHQDPSEQLDCGDR